MRGQQQGGNSSDATSSFFWYFISAVVALMMVWWLGKNYVVHAIFFIRHYEMLFLNGCFVVWNKILVLLHLTRWQVDTSTFVFWQKFMSQVDPKSVIFKQIELLSGDVGIWLRYPVMLILLGMAAYLYFFHTSSRFHQSYTMKSLRQVEHENWPEITPIMGLDLVKTPLLKGPWSMALTPIEFCKQHKLLTLQPNKNNQMEWHLLRAPAHRLLTLQLGPLWRNPLQLPIHIQALIVIFIARAQRDRKIADQLIKQIAVSSHSGQLDFTGVRSLMVKYANSKALIWVLQRHAYVATVLATLLEIARTDGVLGTSEFLWLKPLDRKMWYMLNSVGRYTAVGEVCGIFAHWLAERAFKCPLKAPMVKEAVTGLEIAVKDTLYLEEHEKAWHYDERP